MQSKTSAPDAGRQRCRWASNTANPRYQAYHDEEWGVPCHDEMRLFEMLNLEGAQAGLSWETILNKRDSYRVAFDQWDARKIARYSEKRFARLMDNAGIVRNRLKIAATIGNAKAYLKLCDEVGGLDPFLWGYVGGQPIRNAPRAADRLPASTPLSDTVSKDLKARGFKFVGSTIVYAYLQAVGIVNDHCVECFRFAELTK